MSDSRSTSPLLINADSAEQTPDLSPPLDSSSPSNYGLFSSSASQSQSQSQTHNQTRTQPEASNITNFKSPKTFRGSRSIKLPNKYNSDVHIELEPIQNDGERTEYSESDNRIESSSSRNPGERKEYHMKLFKTPKETTLALSIAATKKVELPTDKLIVFALLGGINLSLGGCFALIVGQGLPGLNESNPGAQRFLQGLCFSTALLYGSMLGGEVFAANLMFMAVGILQKTVPIKKAIFNLVVVFVCNFISCVFGAWFFGYMSDVFATEPWLSNVREIAENKTVHISMDVLFVRAVPANMLACIASCIGVASEDVSSKILGMFFPVIAFASLQYEHCIANMFYVMEGIFYGADTTVWRFFYWNLIPVVSGNIIGGVLVGGLMWYLYVYNTPVPAMPLPSLRGIRTKLISWSFHPNKGQDHDV